MNGRCDGCSGHETGPVPRWLLELARFVGGVTATQQEIEEIGTTVAQVNEAVRALGQRVRVMGEDIGELSAAVEDLTKASQCLERASEQQALLGERHYEEHVIDPLVSTVVSLIYLMDECQADESDTPESIADQFREVNQAVRGGLEQLLAAYGVALFRSKPNTEFDRRTMRAAQTEVTNDKGLDHRVAQSLRCGVRRGERILRCEVVTVHRYEQKAIRPGEAPGLRKVA